MISEDMQELCDSVQVDIYALMHKVQAGLDGVSISHFTDGELEVIKASLEVAAGL